MKKQDHVDFDALENESEPKKKKRFNLFDFIYSRSEKHREEIIYDPNHKRDFLYFFRMFFDHLRDLFILNLMTIIGNFPIFLFLLYFSTNLHTHASAPADAIFAPIYGAMKLGAATPASSALYGLYGASVTVYLPTVLSTVTLIAAIVLLLFTFGPVTVGVTYVMRNIVKGEPVFLWSDFWYAIRRNLKQEFTLGILDLCIIALIAYDLFFFYININGTLTGMFFWLSIFIGIIYLFMRFYLYLMLVTFDLSIPKLFKNAFIFALLGLGRNLIALLGIAVVIFLNLAIAWAYLPLGAVLPLLITVSLCMFIPCYTSWPKIYKIMIEPYQDQQDEAAENKADPGAEPGAEPGENG